jgi:vacuolar-type H+-ATPase subunit I/STV1
MEGDKIIYTELDKLTFDQKIIFGLSCIKRIIHLYTVFENSESITSLETPIPKDKIYDMLTVNIEYISRISENSKCDIKLLDRKIKLLETLLIDSEEDNSIEAIILFQIVVIMIDLLEYIKEKDDEKVQYCTENMIELINQIKGDELLKKYPKKTDEEIDQLLDTLFEEEYEVESVIVEIIKNDVNKLEEYIRENKIRYNNNQNCE